MLLFALISVFSWTITIPNYSDAHDFHLSKCDINYNASEKAIQISLNVFIDDLELALSQDGYDSLRICTPKESPLAEELMLNYFRKHLIIKVDEQPIELNWVGKEVSEDFAAVWSYLEVSNITPEKSISVMNDILLNEFDDQQNVVKLVMDKRRKSFFLFNIKEFEGRLDL